MEMRRMGDEVESNYAPRIKALGMSQPYFLKGGIGGSEFKPLKFEGIEFKPLKFEAGKY